MTTGFQRDWFGWCQTYSYISRLSGKLPSEPTSSGLPSFSDGLLWAVPECPRTLYSLILSVLGEKQSGLRPIISVHMGLGHYLVFCFHSDVLNWIWEASQCHAKTLPKSMLENSGLANAIPMLSCWVLQTGRFLPLCLGSNTAWSSSVLVQHVPWGCTWHIQTPSGPLFPFRTKAAPQAVKSTSNYILFWSQVKE